MNMRTVSAAFVIALTISALCTWLLGRKMSLDAAKGVPEQHYVAPSKPMQPGEVLKAENLVLVKWPQSDVIAGTFTRTEDLIGRSVLYPIEANQPITDKVLAAPGSGIGLAGKIPNGMRAIALHSDEVMGVAGFLFPGSHVDVLVTYHTQQSPDPMTATVLQDSEVLAAGQKVQPDPEGKPVTNTVVTLLLNPEDAQRAVLASTQGAIHFVLRSGSDKTHLPESTLGLSQLAGVPTLVQRPALMTGRRRAGTMRVSAPADFAVETISGDKQKTESFSGAR
jgi:pilus assembly protein CpaB